MSGRVETSEQHQSVHSTVHATSWQTRTTTLIPGSLTCSPEQLRECVLEGSTHKTVDRIVLMVTAVLFKYWSVQPRCVGTNFQGVLC